MRDLGTVARSGSRAFLEQLAQRGQKDARLIGQFGVGFYSAYLVADRVEVVSRAAGAGQVGHRWVSEAKETFTIAPDERAARGTAITLHLREDEREFLDEWRLRDLVKRYSDYVSHPINLRVTKGTGADAKTEYETVNRASALWQRPRSEITEEQYDEFYRHLAHSPEGEKPLARTHFKVEGTQEFAGLLYVPRDKPFEMRFGMKHRGVRLYVKRVLVMEDCEEMVPEWLRFVVGVIDSDDLPLNVSRGDLAAIVGRPDNQEAAREARARRARDAVRRAARRLRHGVASLRAHDQTGCRDRLRVPRSAREAAAIREHGRRGAHSLADYVKRMKDGQDAIYYVIGESRKALEGAPHLEGLRKRGFEVLLMTDPIDEWARSRSARSRERRSSRRCAPT